MELDHKIVIFGMSCVGKTTFAQSLLTHKYLCFDALFQWHLIETLGLSISGNLEYVKKNCDSANFVLDGWHLSDMAGRYLPKDAAVYVVWAPYSQIIGQYRVPVATKEQHLPMYKKWYWDVDYETMPNVRYIRNDGNFKEMSREEFTTYR